MVEQKSITIDKVFISYIEINPSAHNSIFFFHGNSNSNRIWKNQLNSDELSSYRLIAFDLPAHGNSSGVLYPYKSYSVIGLAEIMTKAVIQLAKNRPHIFCGFSLGTNIIAEMLAFNTTPKALVFAGSSIVGGGIKPENVVISNVARNVLFTDVVSVEKSMEYINECCFSDNMLRRNELIEDFNKVKAPFRSAFRDSILNGEYSDEVRIVKNSGLPILSIFGKNERITPSNLLDNLGFKLWENCVFKLPKASHTVMIDQPDNFNSLFGRFVEEIF